MGKLESNLSEVVEQVGQLIDVLKGLTQQRQNRGPTCYNCGKVGHVKKDCRAPPKTNDRQKSSYKQGN